MTLLFTFLLECIPSFDLKQAFIARLILLRIASTGSTGRLVLAEPDQNMAGSGENG